jgi:hypothetical protein
MARRARLARLASRHPALDWSHKSDRAGRFLSGCVAGAPSRSPPRQREDVTGPQPAGLGSPPRVTGAAHRDSRPGSPL